MKSGITLALAAAALVALLPIGANARPPYKAAFAANYAVKPGGNLDRASCNICHMGTNKQIRNVYGIEVAKALGKANASPAEVTAALKKIENMLGPDKKTKFVDLIKADKLPGGP